MHEGIVWKGRWLLYLWKGVCTAKAQCDNEHDLSSKQRQQTAGQGSIRVFEARAAKARVERMSAGAPRLRWRTDREDYAAGGIVSICRWAAP